MMRASVLLGVVIVALTACSGAGDEAAPSTTALRASTAESSTDGADPVADDDAIAATEPPASEPTDPRPGVVAFTGSVESLILDLPDARNFAGGVEEWLTAVPGQEGVLRNSRGVTVFVPVDDGFSEAARDTAFADTDAAALTIGGHLHVGALSELDGTIVVATGAEFTITDGGETIGGRRVVRSVTGTNGVVYLIDGSLTDDAG